MKEELKLKDYFKRELFKEIPFTRFLNKIILDNIINKASCAFHTTQLMIKYFGRN